MVALKANETQFSNIGKRVLPTDASLAVLKMGRSCMVTYLRMGTEEAAT